MYSGFLPGTFFRGGGNLLFANFHCYANFSVVFGPNLRGEKSQEGNCFRGASPVEESQVIRTRINNTNVANFCKQIELRQCGIQIFFAFGWVTTSQSLKICHYTAVRKALEIVCTFTLESWVVCQLEIILHNLIGNVSLNFHFWKV